MKFLRKEKGFTLIELLVVVAIIGVLASIVLASLGSARNRASDAKIKATMSQMRSQAEIFNLDNGSYRGTDTNGWRNDDITECTASPSAVGSIFDENIDEGLTDLMREVQLISRNSDSGIRVFCGVSGTSGDDSWAFAAALLSPEAGSTGWCVDSSGNSKSINADFSNPAQAVLIGSSPVGFICP